MVGQDWKDRDPRDGRGDAAAWSRRVRVNRIEGTLALCDILPDGPQTWLHLWRLRAGFKCLQ